MVKPRTQVRNTDSKGRLALGEGFANRTVIVEQRGNEIVLRLARVIPKREAWLYANSIAGSAVRRGLKQARKGQLSDGPDLREAAAVAKKLKDE